QAADGIRDFHVTGVQTCALPIYLVVTSPGWRPDQPLLAAAQAAAIPVWSEIELARRMQAADGPAWLGITGTNGKTTTVTMLESRSEERRVGKEWSARWVAQHHKQ